MRRIGAGIIVARATHALKERKEEKSVLQTKHRLTWVPAARGKHLGAAGPEDRVWLVPDGGEGDGSGFWGHVVDEAVRELKVHPVRERDRRAAGPPLSRRADRKRREVDVR